MIKRLLRWLFAVELAELRELAESAKAVKPVYVSYERMDASGEEFLSAIAEHVQNNKAILYWLCERQKEYDRLIKYGTQTNRDMNIGRSMCIDEILSDIVKFNEDWKDLLEEKKNAR